MQCYQCQDQNPTGAKFCIECGAVLPHVCLDCVVENLPRPKFWAECGTSLPSSAPTSVETQQHPAIEHQLDPASYTPRHLAEKILTSRNTLEGERKQVTVMFADRDISR